MWNMVNNPDEYGDDYLVLCDDDRYRVASYTRDYGWMCGTYYGGIKAWMKIPSVEPVSVSS